MPLEVVEVGKQVPLSQIIESGQKVRKETADQGLDQLLKSIRSHGQIHAISLIENGDGTYEIGNGHRRFAAATRGDLPTVRATISRVPAGEEENRELLIQQHLYAANMAEPLLEVERVRLVPVFTTVTCASTITAWVVSVTVPRMEPVAVACACRIRLIASAKPLLYSVSMV